MCIKFQHETFICVKRAMQAIISNINCLDWKEIHKQMCTLNLLPGHNCLLHHSSGKVAKIEWICTQRHIEQAISKKGVCNDSKVGKQSLMSNT